MNWLTLAINTCTKANPDAKANTLLPSLWRCIDTANISSIADVEQLIANIIELLLVLGGFIAVGMFIYAGFMYVTSDGDPAGTKKAKDTIFNALVGLILVLAAFGIVRYAAGLVLK